MSSSPRSDHKQHVTQHVPALRGLAAMAAVILPLLAGCPGSLEGNFPPLTGTGGMAGTGGMTGTGGSAVCDAPAEVFGVRCYFCHGPGAQPPDLTTAPIAANLVGHNSDPTTAGTMTTCPNMPFIDRANPSASVILKRVSGTGCGPLMPQGNVSPEATIVTCLTSWVMAQ